MPGHLFESACVETPFTLGVSNYLPHKQRPALLGL